MKIEEIRTLSEAEIDVVNGGGIGDRARETAGKVVEAHRNFVRELAKGGWAICMWLQTNHEMGKLSRCS